MNAVARFFFHIPKHVGFNAIHAWLLSSNLQICQNHNRIFHVSPAMNAEECASMRPPKISAGTFPTAKQKSKSDSKPDSKPD